MLRTTATRSLLRRFSELPTVHTSRSSYNAASASFRNASLRQLTNKRPQVFTPLRPASKALFATNKDGPPFDKIDVKREAMLAEKKLKPDPEHVSTASSTIPVLEPKETTEEDADMLGAIKADITTVKETFSLDQVPKESFYLGAAGVLPYAATAASTVYLAFDINHANDYGSGYLFSPETAHQLLEWITPIQIGYGAVIISFLGAIHWGLEYAGYGGHHSYRRYMYGVIAPAVAWPTIFMPVEYALITQFASFVFLYFADARATIKGWFPPWYSTYRFVLTFFVGASIVATLVGRGQIVAHDHSLKTAVDYVKPDKDAQWEALEREEKERSQKLAEEEEADEDGGEKEEDGGEDEEKEGDDNNKGGEKKDSKKEKK